MNRLSAVAAAIRRRADGYCFGGLIIAVWFLSLSLTPSLLPRTAVIQGVLGGIAAATGYALGTGATWLWRYLGVPEPGAKPKRLIRLATSVAVGGMLVWFLSQASTWQNRSRVVFGLEEVDDVTYRALVLTVAVAVFVLVVGLARSIMRLLRWLTNRAQRHLPPRVARVIATTLVVVLVWSILTDVFVATAVSGLQGVFSVQNGTTAAGVERPDSPLLAGSHSSLVDWDTIGRPGRGFVVSAPSVQELNEFSDGGAVEPIRTYVGLESAESAEERADLLLRELIRVGAFERDVLVLATSTGSGGIDQRGILPLEYLHNGDTAVAGIQYSYLPSWLSLYVDQVAARDEAAAAFDAVYGHWTELDDATRPEFYLFGVSLGSFGSESSVASLKVIDDPIDGAVWAGPTFLNRQWNRLTTERDVGSPVWLPTVGGGRVARFTGRENRLDEPPEDWGKTRLVYIQHPSDPVTFFSFELLLNEPRWLSEGRPPDFTPDMHWYPFVTFWQVALDLPAGGSVPPGYGHSFGTAAYVDAWAGVSEPEDWSTAHSDRLKARLGP